MELIVTQWDVNKTYAKIFEELKAELIVTQWDVNAIESISNVWIGLEFERA